MFGAVLESHLSLTTTPDWVEEVFFFSSFCRWISTERLIAFPESHSSRMMPNAVSDLEHVHITTSLVAFLWCTQTPMAGSVLNTGNERGRSWWHKGGEVKTSPTLIPLYNFILGQPMLVFSANMEPLPFPVSDGAWKDASFTESRSLQSES